MPKKDSLVCLDVGEKRIGVAVGDNMVKIAIPFETIEVDGGEVKAIADIVAGQNADVLVIGYPRNQSGESTKQTEFVENFSKQLQMFAPKVVFQDESLTSVIAEQRLVNHKRPYTKADIDAQAAAIILQDYIELNYA